MRLLINSKNQELTKTNQVWYGTKRYDTKIVTMLKRGNFLNILIFLKSLCQDLSNDTTL